MKHKNVLIIAVSLCCLLFSCKKESNTTSSSEMNVRYEVTWTGSLDTSISGTGANQLAYINTTGNNQFDNLPGSGNSYIKTVTIPSSAHVQTVIAQSIIMLHQAGSGEIKIYVNDELKADQTAITTQGIGTYNLILLTHWNVK